MEANNNVKDYQKVNRVFDKLSKSKIKYVSKDQYRVKNERIGDSSGMNNNSNNSFHFEFNEK